MMHMKIPFFITNLSSTSRVVLPKDHVMAFITPENPETNYIEIVEVQSIEDECRNWKHPTKMLPKAPKSDFLVSPGDIKEVRGCVLPESNITNKTCESFRQLLDKYQAAFSTSSEDIGHTETHYNGHQYRPQLTCVTETLHTPIKTSQLGQEGNRAARACKCHQKEPQSMGQSYSHSTKEVWTWRASQEEDVHGLPSHKCAADQS